MGNMAARSGSIVRDADDSSCTPTGCREDSALAGLRVRRRGLFAGELVGVIAAGAAAPDAGSGGSWLAAGVIFQIAGNF